MNEKKISDFFTSPSSRSVKRSRSSPEADNQCRRVRKLFQVTDILGEIECLCHNTCFKYNQYNYNFQMIIFDYICSLIIL